MSYSLASVLDQPVLHIWIWEEDGVHIAKCLDIPGCISEGATRDEALANIHDAIKLCLDVIKEDRDKQPPQPPGVEMIEAPISDFIESH
ncbi:MAG TPA: type II toxin-antitoxin system HicB family antitoxin [Bryobacteraceae bacterium]|nr:type II toxin-antitoxin system HicB family antitoxin [Bryobacteraceae bacterium]